MTKLPDTLTLKKLRETRTMQQIAEMYQTTRQAVSWRLSREYPTSKQKARVARNRHIREQFVSTSLSPDAIGEEFGISGKSVSRICKGLVRNLTLKKLDKSNEV